MQVECKATGASSLGRSQDVSEGGLLLLAGDTFDVQAAVVVRFHLPPYPPGTFIEVQGVVVRVEPGEFMGIQFLELKDPQRKAIANFVHQADTGSEK